MSTDIPDLVEALVAAHDFRGQAQLPHETHGLGIEAAREVGAAVVRRLCEHRNERVAGYKVGLTSSTSQAAMGTREPVFGELLGSWIMTSPATIERSELYDPVLEAELAFVFDESLSIRPSREEVVAKSFVVAALEVPDSRYAGWYPVPDAMVVDLVADNSFAGRLVHSAPVVRAATVDLAAMTVDLKFEGEVVERGTGAAVLGDPVEAVLWLSRQLAERRTVVEAGDVVSSGALTTPIAGGVGTYEVEVPGVGTARLEIVPGGRDRAAQSS